MANEITKIKGRWILDSRGNPTVEADLWAGDVFARAAVPSGASTGDAEALELRDGGKNFMGKHVLKAVANINDKIAPKLAGMRVANQEALDFAMLDLDGTETKSNLGANAILAVSLAAAKAAAKVEEKPLFQYIYEISHQHDDLGKYLLPVPASNVLNGGKHAGTALAIQEFMILPIGAKTFPEALQMVVETYHNLKGILKDKYGKSSINVGDEGGFAPNLKTTNETLDIIVEAIEKAGYTDKIILGMDAAASEFFEDGKYHVDGTEKSPDEMVDYYLDIIKSYPLRSLEDPFDEDDFDSFAALTAKIPDGVNIVDDDLTVTNVHRLQKAIDMKAGNALLLKVNQIGSLTEAIAAATLSFQNDFSVMVSHRSGETCDNTIADIAVGLCTGFIKTGAPCRSDRNSKYNQLLRINEILGEKARYPKNFTSYKDFQ
ncbi:phosphopyruvate hydratase [Candidatus Bathyarchaeota archaeon]|nr:phosphopyruvate hydratase [Candidatus Bathyarchaeota archaeon]